MTDLDIIPEIFVTPIVMSKPPQTSPILVRNLLNFELFSIMILDFIIIESEYLIIYQMGVQFSKKTENIPTCLDDR